MLTDEDLWSLACRTHGNIDVPSGLDGEPAALLHLSVDQLLSIMRAVQSEVQLQSTKE